MFVPLLYEWKLTKQKHCWSIIWRDQPLRISVLKVFRKLCQLLCLNLNGAWWCL